MRERLQSSLYTERQAAYMHLDDFCSDEVRVERIVEYGLLGALLETVYKSTTDGSELMVCLALLQRLCRHAVCQQECANSKCMSCLVSIIGKAHHSEVVRASAMTLVSELLSFSTDTNTLVTVDLVRDCEDIISGQNSNLRDCAFQLLRSIVLLSPNVSPSVLAYVDTTVLDLILRLGTISDPQLDLLSVLCDNVSVSKKISHAILSEWHLEKWTSWTMAGWKLLSAVTTDVDTKIYFATKYLPVTISCFLSEPAASPTFPYLLLVLLNLAEYPPSKSVMRNNTEFLSKLRFLSGGGSSEDDDDDLARRYSAELERDLFFLP